MQPGQIEPRERDAAAVERARGGDAGAFDELVLRYRDLVYTICYQVLQDVHAAEDVCQNALLTACTHLETLSDPGSFAPWLKKIALRECTAWGRRLSPRRAAEDEVRERSMGFDPFLDAVAESDDEYALWCERIERAVEELSQAQCEILGLFYVRGLSHEEIANFLDVPRGTVKRRLFDARKSLQDAVGADAQSARRQEEARRYLEAFHRALDARNGTGASNGRDAAKE